MLGHYKAPLHRFFDPVARLLFRARVRPNHLTVLGLGVSIAAAYVFSVGRLRWGAALLAVAGLFDFFEASAAPRPPPATTTPPITKPELSPPPVPAPPAAPFPAAAKGALGQLRAFRSAAIIASAEPPWLAGPVRTTHKQPLRVTIRTMSNTPAAAVRSILTPQVLAAPPPVPPPLAAVLVAPACTEAASIMPATASEPRK